MQVSDMYLRMYALRFRPVKNVVTSFSVKVAMRMSLFHILEVVQYRVGSVAKTCQYKRLIRSGFDDVEMVLELHVLVVISL